MADDITIPATGSGTATPVVATDDVSGVHYQKMKLDLGGDGASVPVSGSLPTSGDVAHDAVDSGNPVKIGGKVGSSSPIAAGDRVDAYFGQYGQLAVGLMDLQSGNVVSLRQVQSDAWSTTFGVAAAATEHVYNGSTWDRSRSVSIGDASAATGIPAAGLMGYNGSTWDRVRVANTGRLQVDVVTGGGGGTQYVGDAAATATPTGTVAMGLANAAAPTDVSANNDAVALWALRNGSQVVNIASGDTLITAGQKAMSASLPVAIASDQSAVPVSGTFWQATQPVSAASLPLPSGAATSALQGGGLPSALASDRLKVDGSGVTQPVSGTVTANAGTGTLATSLAAGPPPHNLGVTYLSIAANFTGTTTSTNLLAGTGGQRIYVTSITVSIGGTTAGRVSIYWGTGAFSAGTSVTLLDAEFAPSTTSKPGAVLTFTVPVGGASATGDNLRITTTGITDCHVAGQAYKA